MTNRADDRADVCEKERVARQAGRADSVSRGATAGGSALLAHLRIFISSPGDVVEERQLAREAILELSREPQFEAAYLNAVSWDDPHGRTPLVAQLDPQSAVERGLPRPSRCDVVVGVFWARMGSPLPVERHQRPDGSPYLSGTEYEIADAFAATAGPDVLLYRRDQEPLWGARDPERQEKQDQLERLDAYLETLKAEHRYIDLYPAPGDFKERLKNDLRQVLAARLRTVRQDDSAAGGKAAPAAVVDTDLALARLAEMPLDVVPDPAPLPPGSHMPLARTALLVGRDPDLRALADRVRSDPPAVGATLVVTGLGGVGKSQVAAEFAHRYGQYFLGGVFWLGFADPLAIPGEVATCGGSGGLDLRDDFGDLPLEEQVRLVTTHWQGPAPRLLVFDGCEDETLLRQWLPPAGASRVLVTSRRETWSPGLGVREVRLGVLARPASVMLLRAHRDDLDLDDGDLDAIAEELGDLPLALHLCGSFLARYRHSELGQPARYLKRLQRSELPEQRAPTSGGRTATAEEQQVARTLELSYERLDATDPVDAMAQATLARAACFAAGSPIPRRLLRIAAAVGDEDEEAALRFEDGILRLRELGLMGEEGDGRLVLHRLLAGFVRRQVADLDTVRGAVEAAVLGEARALNEAGQSARLIAWQPHLRKVAERAAEAASEHAGDLLTSLGYHLDVLADVTGAEAAYRRALEIDEERLGPADPKVATALNNLGGVLQELGDPAGARAAYERALGIDQEAYGAEHPKVAIRIANLALLRQELGDLDGAREGLERALEIDAKAHGAEAPEVATDLSNLGRVLRQQDDLVGAKAAFEGALEIGQKVLRADHPDLAVYVNNLGSVLQDLGDLAGAKAAYQRALEIDEKAYGPEHVKVAIRINNLGSVLRAEGDVEGAKAAYEQALPLFQRGYGPKHPNTRRVRAHLIQLRAPRLRAARAGQLSQSSQGKIE